MNTIFKNNNDACFIRKPNGVFSIGQEEYDELSLSLDTEDCPIEFSNVPNTALTNKQYTEAFRAEQLKRLAETDWIHYREMDRAELSKGKHSKFTELCTYREALRDMDKAQGFDVTNPVFPDKPE